MKKVSLFALVVFFTLPIFSSNMESRVRIAPAAVEILADWYCTHMQNPYPNAEEKQALANAAGIESAQVTTWFINKRRRDKGHFDSSPAEFSRALLPHENLAIEAIFRRWKQDHSDYPFPSEAEIAALALRTQLSIDDVQAWFSGKHKKVPKKFQKPCLMSGFSLFGDDRGTTKKRSAEKVPKDKPRKRQKRESENPPLTSMMVVPANDDVMDTNQPIIAEHPENIFTEDISLDDVFDRPDLYPEPEYDWLRVCR